MPAINLKTFQLHDDVIGSVDAPGHFLTFFLIDWVLKVVLFVNLISHQCSSSM